MNKFEMKKILKEDVEKWNKWRRENLSIKIDLSEADLSGADLRGTNLRGADLWDTIF